MSDECPYEEGGGMVLYTSQKTKKAKTWHDGILDVGFTGTRAVLFDDKKSRLDIIHIKLEDVIVGEQLESDRYYIQVEEEKEAFTIPAASTGIISSSSGANSSFSAVTPNSTSVRAGLKRKKMGFIPPRQMKQAKTDDFSQVSIVDTESSQTIIPRPSGLFQRNHPKCRNIMDLYSASASENNTAIDKCATYLTISPKLSQINTDSQDNFSSEKRLREKINPFFGSKSPQNCLWSSIGSRGVSDREKSQPQSDNSEPDFCFKTSDEINYHSVVNNAFSTDNVSESLNINNLSKQESSMTLQGYIGCASDVQSQINKPRRTKEQVLALLNRGVSSKCHETEKKDNGNCLQVHDTDKQDTNNIDEIMITSRISSSSQEDQMFDKRFPNCSIGKEDNIQNVNITSPFCDSNVSDMSEDTKFESESDQNYLMHKTKSTLLPEQLRITTNKIINETTPANMNIESVKYCSETGDEDSQLAACFEISFSPLSCVSDSEENEKTVTQSVNSMASREISYSPLSHVTDSDESIEENSNCMEQTLSFRKELRLDDYDSKSTVEILERSGKFKSNHDNGDNGVEVEVISGIIMEHDLVHSTDMKDAKRWEADMLSRETEQVYGDTDGVLVRQKQQETGVVHPRNIETFSLIDDTQTLQAIAERSNSPEEPQLSCQTGSSHFVDDSQDSSGVYTQEVAPLPHMNLVCGRGCASRAEHDDSDVSQVIEIQGGSTVSCRREAKEETNDIHMTAFDGAPRSNGGADCASITRVEGSVLHNNSLSSESTRFSSIPIDSVKTGHFDENFSAPNDSKDILDYSVSSSGDGEYDGLEKNIGAFTLDVTTENKSNPQTPLLQANDMNNHTDTNLMSNGSQNEPKCDAHLVQGLFALEFSPNSPQMMSCSSGSCRVDTCPPDRVPDSHPESSHWRACPSKQRDEEQRDILDMIDNRQEAELCLEKNRDLKTSPLGNRNVYAKPNARVEYAEEIKKNCDIEKHLAKNTEINSGETKEHLENSHHSLHLSDAQHDLETHGPLCDASDQEIMPAVITPSSSLQSPKFTQFPLDNITISSLRTPHIHATQVPQNDDLYLIESESSNEDVLKWSAGTPLRPDHMPWVADEGTAAPLPHPSRLSRGGITSTIQELDDGTHTIPIARAAALKLTGYKVRGSIESGVVRRDAVKSPPIETSVKMERYIDEESPSPSPDDNATLYWVNCGSRKTPFELQLETFQQVAAKHVVVSPVPRSHEVPTWTPRPMAEQTNQEVPEYSPGNVSTIPTMEDLLMSSQRCMQNTKTLFRQPEVSCSYKGLIHNAEQFAVPCSQRDALWDTEQFAVPCSQRDVIRNTAQADLPCSQRDLIPNTERSVSCSPRDALWDTQHSGVPCIQRPITLNVQSAPSPPEPARVSSIQNHMKPLPSYSTPPEKSDMPCSQRKKNPLKSRPYEDQFTHTSFQGYHFSPPKSEKKTVQVDSPKDNIVEQHPCMDSTRCDEFSLPLDRVPISPTYSVLEMPTGSVVSHDDYSALSFLKKCNEENAQIKVNIGVPYEQLILPNSDSSQLGWESRASSLADILPGNALAFKHHQSEGRETCFDQQSLDDSRLCSLRQPNVKSARVEISTYNEQSIASNMTEKKEDGAVNSRWGKYILEDEDELLDSDMLNFVTPDTEQDELAVSNSSIVNDKSPTVPSNRFDDAQKSALSDAFSNNDTYRRSYMMSHKIPQQNMSTQDDFRTKFVNENALYNEKRIEGHQANIRMTDPSGYDCVREVMARSSHLSAPSPCMNSQFKSPVMQQSSRLNWSPSSAGGLSPSAGSTVNGGSPSTRFRAPVVNTKNTLMGSARNLCGDLQFPSKMEVDKNDRLIRQISFPVTYPNVGAYKQTFIAALKEHMNINLFQLSKSYHNAITKVDTDAYSVTETVSIKHRGKKTKVAINNNPACICGNPSKMIQVKKEGRNKGRFFYGCSANRSDQCKFFQWADQPSRGGSECTYDSSVAKISLRDAAGYNTFMRGHQILFYCESQFLRKTRETKFKKGIPAWARTEESTAVKKTFIKISKKDASSVYSKDDLWIISTDLHFSPGCTFLARSVYFGPNANCEVEIEPLVGYSPSIWENNATCHALLSGNVSSELTCMYNLQDHVSLTTLPILPHFLSRNGTTDICESREVSKKRFNAPVQIKQKMYAPADYVTNLSEEFVQQFQLNTDQAITLDRVSTMFNSTDTSDPIILIHGVFGAGKSFLLAVITRFLVKIFEESDVHTPGLPHPWKILISSTTNVAVDRILMGLLEIGFEDFVRVGSVKKIAKPVLPYSVHGSGTDSQELKDLQEMLRGDITPSEKQHVRRSIEKHRLGENKKKLAGVRVVGVTCASCPFSCLSNMSFPVVLLDECSQMTEPTSLLPIARFQCEKLVLVGDPRQLDPTIQGSGAAHGEGLEQTLFDRLIRMGYIPVMLRTQYRCHPKISAMVNKLFYDGELIDGISEEDRPNLLNSDIFPTISFYDVASGHENWDGTGSYSNDREAEFVVVLIEALVIGGLEPSNIGVITLYKSQMYRIIMTLHGSKVTDHKELKSILVSTVDAFQGGERQIIILSCVRTNNTGFIDNDKRINVALTRAKNHLLIVGHQKNLNRNKLWSKIICHCKESEGGLKSSEAVLQQIQELMKDLSSQSNKESTASTGIKRKRNRKKKSTQDEAVSVNNSSPPLSLSDTLVNAISSNNIDADSQHIHEVQGSDFVVMGSVTSSPPMSLSDSEETINKCGSPTKDMTDALLDSVSLNARRIRRRNHHQLPSPSQFNVGQVVTSDDELPIFDA